jgi:hypothetical protein
MNEEGQREAQRMLKSEGFTRCDRTEAWFSHEQRKHFSAESTQDTSLNWLRARLEEKVPEGEFWFHSYYVLEPDRFQRPVSKYELSGRKPIPKQCRNFKAGVSWQSLNPVATNSKALTAGGIFHRLSRFHFS